MPRRLPTASPIAAAIAVLLISGARADTDWVAESLADGTCDAAGCTVEGGQFTGAGWQVTSASSRLHFDLEGAVPGGVDCGTLEVTFTQFDPIGGGHTGEYVNFAGLYEGDHGSNWAAAGADETQIQIQGTCDQCVGVQNDWRDYRLKFKAGPCSWDEPDCTSPNCYVPANNTYDIDWDATLDTVYSASTSWSCAGVSHVVDDGDHHWTCDKTWAWHGVHPDPRPNILHAFVGKDHSGANGAYLDGAIVVSVRITEHDSCDCGGEPGDDDTSGDDDATADDDTAGDDDATADDDDTSGEEDDDAGDDDGGDDDAGGPEDRPWGGCACRGDGLRGTPSAHAAAFTIAALGCLTRIRRPSSGVAR